MCFGFDRERERLRRQSKTKTPSVLSSLVVGLSSLVLYCGYQARQDDKMKGKTTRLVVGDRFESESAQSTLRHSAQGGRRGLRCRGGGQV